MGSGRDDQQVAFVSLSRVVLVDVVTDGPRSRARGERIEGLTAGPGKASQQLYSEPAALQIASPKDDAVLTSRASPVGVAMDERPAVWRRVDGRGDGAAGWQCGDRLR